jgi:hypothetical protein
MPQKVNRCEWQSRNTLSQVQALHDLEEQKEIMEM